MNFVQTKQRIDFYNDLTRNARFFFNEYSMAVNDVVNEYIKEQAGDENNRDVKSFQWNQRIRDNLYTLIKNTSPAVTQGAAVTNRYFSSTPSSIVIPPDYDTLISISCLINSLTVYAKPTTYNEQGPLLEDSFKYPTNKRVYYNEAPNNAGITIWRGATGTLTSCSFTYLRFPVNYSCGQESDIVTSGNLTNLAAYYATETTVYNLTTYQVGDAIVGTGAALTSGAVILASAGTPIDLPLSVHEDICKRASARMLLTIAQYEGAGAISSVESK